MSPIERSRRPNEPWRQIVELLEKEAGPDDLVMGWYATTHQVPQRYYRIDERVKARRLKLWKTGDVYPTMSAALSTADRLSYEQVFEHVSAALADVEGHGLGPNLRIGHVAGGCWNAGAIGSAWADAGAESLLPARGALSGVTRR